MQLRHVFQLVVVGVFLILGLIVYFYGSFKLKDAETEIVIRKAKDIQADDDEEVLDIEEEYDDKKNN